MVDTISMKFIKSTELSSYFTQLARNGFSECPVFKWKSGKFYGGLSDDYIINAIMGLNWRSHLIFQCGDKKEFSDYHPNSRNVKPVELKLEEILSKALGSISVQYQKVDFEGELYFIAEVVWDYQITTKIDDFLIYYDRKSNGSNYIGFPPPFQRVHEGYSEDALREWSRRRELIDPSAVELTIEVRDLPHFIGLGSYANKRSCAALGLNWNVDSSVYIRGRPTHKYKIIDLLNFVNRESFFNATHVNVIKNQAKTLFNEQVSVGCVADKSEVTLSSKTDKVYRVGGSIFETINSLEIIACRYELFRDSFAIPEKYLESLFLENLVELAVNAYVHGHWESGFDPDCDLPGSHRYVANSVAFVHFGNRLEVVNRHKGKLTFSGHRKLRSTFSDGVGPLHLALRDINLAHCRNFGIKKIRTNLRRLGMPSPIIIDDGTLFRFVFPLKNEFEHVFIPPSNMKHDVSYGNICKYFAAKLLKLIGVLNGDILASVFKVDIKSAEEILFWLEKDGICSVDKAAVYRGPGRVKRPSFTVNSAEQADTAAENYIQGMARLPAPTSMSLAGLFHLCRTDFDRERFWPGAGGVADIFKKEGIYGKSLSSMIEHYNHLLKAAAVSVGHKFNMPSQDLGWA